MSAASDKYERDVASYINSLPGVKAERPVVGTDYPDVLVEYNGKKTFIEVKMSHTDNLSNPRLYFANGKWQSSYQTPVARYAEDILNNSFEAKKFLDNISKYSGIPQQYLKIPTTRSGIKEEGAVPLHIMKDFFNKYSINKYIANKANQDLGKIVTEHYTAGKTKPANYLQAGDDFYRIGKEDPFNLGLKIPELKGNGDFKVRISTRSEFYEIQAEVKIKTMPYSPYSLKPGTRKLNPFK